VRTQSAACSAAEKSNRFEEISAEEVYLRHEFVHVCAARVPLISAAVRFVDCHLCTTHTHTHTRYKSQSWRGACMCV
jgi:hypothetical protein